MKTKLLFSMGLLFLIAGSLFAAESDPVVTVTVGEKTTTESSGKPATFVIKRTGSTAQSLNVMYSLSGTAANGIDYTQLATSAVIPAGASSVTIQVKAINDTIAEPEETVTLTLQTVFAQIVLSPNLDFSNLPVFLIGPTNDSLYLSGEPPTPITFDSTLPVNPSALTFGYRVGDASSATVVIAQNDADSARVPSVTLTGSEEPASESGPTTTVFKVKRFGPGLAKSLRVEYEVASNAVIFNNTGNSTVLPVIIFPSPATEGVDYEKLSGVVEIPANATEATIKVVPIDDKLAETTEVVTLRLKPSSAYDINEPSQAKVSILDNDPAPPTDRVTLNISATKPAVSETGSQPGEFTITRSGPENVSITAIYTISGTAGNGVDYQKLSGSVVIPAGVKSVTIPVVPIPDKAIEPTETVIATIKPPFCAAIFPPPLECYVVGESNRAVVNILDGAPGGPPTVKLIAPVNGATYTAPARIELAAQAEATGDKYVSKVTFYAGDKLLHVATNNPASASPVNPFQFVWTNVVEGEYAIYAVATDSAGLNTSTTSTRITVKPDNTPPTVSIGLPINGGFLSTDNTFSSSTIYVSAFDKDGQIVKLELLVDGVVVETRTGVSSEVTQIQWRNSIPGTHALSARATDNKGAVTTSATNWVVIAASKPPIQVAAVLPSSPFSTTNNIALAATASHPNGAPIAKVEFYVDEKLVGSATQQTDNAYRLVVPSLAPGVYVFRAQAADTQGETGYSPSVLLRVATNQTALIRSVTITKPADNTLTREKAIAVQLLVAPTLLPAASKVEILLDGQTFKTLEANTNQIQTALENIYGGTHILVAKITEPDGTIYYSPGISLRVLTPPAPPKVKVVSPGEGASYEATATITVRAEASSPDAALKQVKLYGTSSSGDRKLLGTFTEPPYSVSWAKVATGNYALTAEAEDVFGSRTTSVPVNIRVGHSPTVKLLSPENGQTFSFPATIELAAQAEASSDRHISTVAFYAGDKLLRITTNYTVIPPIINPFQFVWSNVVAGGYSLRAVATDSSGESTTSAIVHISVRSTNAPPFTAITSPANGSYVSPENNSLSRPVYVAARDEDGRVAKLELLVDGKVVESRTNEITALTLMHWTNIISGAHSLSSRATDDHGVVFTSAPSWVMAVVANRPPVIASQNPLSSISGTNSVKFRVSVTDPERDKITTVRFFLNNQFIGTATNESQSLYGLVLPNLPAGVYYFHAQAADARGAVGYSRATPVKVGVNSAASSLPNIIINQPVDGAIIRTKTIPVRLAIIPTGAPTNAPANRVELLLDDKVVKVLEAKTNLIETVLEGVYGGYHLLFARLTLPDGTVNYSTPVSLSVLLPPAPPTVEVARPLEGSRYIAGASVPILVQAESESAAIQQVQVFSSKADSNERKLIGTTTSTSATIIWTNVATGVYTLTADAVDVFGSRTTSVPKHITVGLPDGPTLVTVHADTSEIREASTNAGSFTITRSGSTATYLNVHYTLSGSAENGVDYKLLSGLAVIPAGRNFTTVNIAPIDDKLKEGNETVTLKLSQLVFIQAPGPEDGYLVEEPSSATMTILDGGQGLSEFPPKVNINSPTNGSRFLAGRNIQFQIEGADADGYIVNMQLYAGDKVVASQTRSYIVQPRPGEIATFGMTWENVLAGEYQMRAVATDNTGRRGESSIINIVVDAGQTNNTVSVTATVPEVPEQGAKSPGIFTIRRTGSTKTKLNVHYTLGGTAENGVDYEKLSGLAVIPAGETTVTVKVDALPDNLNEGTETVELKLTQLYYFTTPLPEDDYVVGKPDTATVRIANSRVVNHGPSTDILSPATGSRFSAGSSIEVKIRAVDLDGYITGAELYSGDKLVASETRNYLVAPKTGDPAEFVLVWDNVPAGTYRLTAKAIDNQGQHGGSASIEVIVSASDVKTVVTVTAPTAEVLEGNPARPGVFKITRTGSKQTKLNVHYAMSGTAQNGVDYQELSGLAVIPAGESSVLVQLVPVPDKALEGKETAILTLQQLVFIVQPGPEDDYTVGNPKQAAVTIYETENGGSTALPTVNITASTPVAIINQNSSGKFTVKRTGSVDTDLTVLYTISGSAVPGVDYARLPGAVVIPKGQSSTVIEVSPLAAAQTKQLASVVVTLDVPHCNPSEAQPNVCYEAGPNDRAAVYLLTLPSLPDGTGGVRLQIDETPIDPVSFYAALVETDRDDRGNVKLSFTGLTGVYAVEALNPDGTWFPIGVAGNTSTMFSFLTNETVTGNATTFRARLMP